MRKILLKAMTLIATGVVWQSVSGSENIVCNNGEYLTCLGASQAKCISVWESADVACSKRHPISIESSREEAQESAEQYGSCASEKFFSGLSDDQETLNKCDGYLATTFDEDKARVLKEKQELKRRQKQLDKYLNE